MNYRKFDTERFLKDSRHFALKRKQLERDLKYLLDLTAISQDTPVQTSNIADTVGTTAVKREEIQNKLDIINRYISALDNSRKVLDDRENDCIEIFFFKRGYIYALVDDFCYRWHVSPSECYRIRRRAIDKLSTSLEEIL